MGEQIHDSRPRRSSPSRTRDRDGNESSKIKRRDVPSRSGRSPVQLDGVSSGFDVRRSDWEQDGIRREGGYSPPYEAEMQIRDGFSNENLRDGEEEERDNERYRKHSHLQKDAFSGKHYPNRSESSETVHHGSRGLIRSKQGGLSDERESSRFIASRDYKHSPSEGRRNVLRNDETDRLESNSLNYSDSSRRRLNGERYSDTCIQESSPMSQVGSSGADFQDESSRLVSLDSRRCIGVGDSGRKQEYSENRCASQVLQTRHLDDYVARNSPRDHQEKSFRDLSYYRGLSCGDHDSLAVSKFGKEMVDESRKNYQLGTDIAVREFPCVRHGVKNMDIETDLLIQPRGYLSESYVHGSHIVDADAKNNHLELCMKERMSDQYDSMKEHSMKEHYSLAELGSSLVNERDDQAHHYKDVRYEQRKVVSLDNKCQLLRKDYQYDGVDSIRYLDRDDKALQRRTICLNKEKEAYLDIERKAVYSDNKRQELGNEYYYGNDGGMHSDVHGADIMVDKDGRVVQLQRECLDKEKAAYLDKGRDDVYLHHKSQQLKKEYDYGTDVNRLDIVVDRGDARGLRYRGASLNDRKEAYLQCESHQFLKDHETDSYASMHPDAYLQCERQQFLKDHETDSYATMHPDGKKSEILVDQEDVRGLRYRREFFNDGREAYLQCESQQFLKDHETDSHAMMHHGVNKSEILVNREYARGGQRYRRVILNDGREAYLQCESHHLPKDHEIVSYATMHPDVNKSDIPVDREDARALEFKGLRFNDGKESYLDNEKNDAYLRYESQQLKKDYDYGIDDRIYRNVNSSSIIVDHGDARALDLRRVPFNDGNEANFGNESNDVYLHYKIPQREKNYDSYPDANRSEIVVEQEAARALELRGVSLNDGREAYLHYENNQLLKDHEIDAYEMMHPYVSRSSAQKQDGEALRCRRYVSHDRNQVYVDDERLQLQNMRYQDGRQEVYHSNDEMLLTRDDYDLRSGAREDAGEVTHENMADDYNYSEVRQLRMSYEKPDSGRFRNHEIAYEEYDDYRDKLGNYEVEGGTRTEQSLYFVDERRNFVGNDDHASTLPRTRPRVSAKERLGGRVEDSRVDVKSRVLLHQVRNPKRKGKSHNRKQQNIS